MRANEVGSLYIYDRNRTFQLNGSVSNSLVQSTKTFNARQASYVNNKGWRQSIRRGSSYPVSPYDVTWNKINSVAVGKATTYDRSTGRILQVTERNYTPNFGLQPFINSVRNEALSKYRNKLADSSGAFQALIPLAEAKELRGLVNTMADSVPGMLHAITDIRRGKVRDAFKYASDKWLAWSFGFSPLMSDASSVALAIAKRIEPTPYVKIRASSERTQMIELTNPSDEGVGAYSRSFTQGSIIQTCKVTYTGTYKVGISAGVNYESAAKQFGITIPHLFPLAWELVPYSFVIDYFTNIGDVINDTFIAGPTATSLMTSEKNVCLTHKTRRIVPTSGFAVNGDISDESYESGSFTRALLATLPSRTFQFESFGSIGKIKRVINLASILAK